MNKKTVFAVFAACCVCSASTFLLSKNYQVAPLSIRQPPKPDLVIFAAAKQALERVRERSDFKEDWAIATNPDAGLMETNWFHTHKGEVILKVQIAVWGPVYRVEVWQKILIYQYIEKTESARQFEYGLQSEIEKALHPEKPDKANQPGPERTYR